MKFPEKWPRETYFELMALAQHHGVPTRLLDWSRQPYAAAFFAASSALPDYKSWTPSDHLAVWILNIECINLYGGSVQIVEPPWSITPHLAAQSALFTVHTLKGSRMEDLQVVGLDHELARLPSPPLLKMTLPKTESVKLYKLCSRVGITAASLFPSPDGAGKAVKDSINLWKAERWLDN